jgi:Holliday junction resolvasome RuvABC endonuclease subunit
MLQVEALAVLGLDVSSRATGVALMTDEWLQSSGAYTCLKPKSKVTFERAFMQAAALHEFLAANRRPTFAVIESYAFHARGNAIHGIVEAGTMIRYELYRQCIPWMTINPARMKKFVAAKGNAKKPQVGEGVSELWEFEHKDHNIVDAVALAGMGWELACFQHAEVGKISLNPWQTDILEKILPEYEAMAMKS